jgi:Rap1a immunity proteins
MNTRKKIFFYGILFLGGLLVFSRYAGAQNPVASTYSGNDLLRDCSDRNDGPSFSFCLGYINGLRDGVVFASVGLGAKPSFEISEKVELGQLKDVVVKYLNEHPEERHSRAAVLVQSALVRAFPRQK